LHGQEGKKLTKREPMLVRLKAFMRAVLPVRVLRTVPRRRELRACVSLLLEDTPNASLLDKIRIIVTLYIVSFSIESPHTQDEIISFIRTMLTLPAQSRGVVVEAGCFKGSSTAKFSMAAKLAGRTLVVFDSFEGIPENDEAHERNIFGEDATFKKGDYCGSIETVRRNVARYGEVNSCRFIKGWFDETLSDFREPIAAIYLDVDLASSTRTCISYLYPLLEKGGSLYSQDGHLPLVIDVFEDDDFWRGKVGCRKPDVQGLGGSRLIRVVKQR
jgi:O-methyltransferase